MKREYVWISTKAEDGKTATVMAHHKTQDQAARFAAEVNSGGYEGPVPKDMYPVGREFSIVENAA